MAILVRLVLGVVVAAQIAHVGGRAVAAEPTAAIQETEAIWTSQETIKSTDLVRFRDQWVCLIQTEKELRILG